MAFRVIRRVAEADATPAYHASMTVRSRPKARMATHRPQRVRRVLSFRLKAFLKSSFSSMGENPFIQNLQRAGLSGGAGVMGHKDDRLAKIAVEPLHEREN